MRRSPSSLSPFHRLGPLHQHEAAIAPVLRVLLQNPLGRRSAAPEEVQDQRPARHAQAAVGLAVPLGGPWVYIASMGVDSAAPVRLRTREQLDTYMNGSPATVGRVIAPLLGVPADRREDVARLGVAFQLTNFLRDVREDYAMDRASLPGLDEEAPPAGRPAPAPAGELARARELFGSARAVLASATPRVRPGIRLACLVYRIALGGIERRGVVAG